ncbi:ammonia-forming cytochrome c nitrite reductase subunit c552 [Candidatus Hecatella orcuttiae]|jgi:formate-dependent nitrite reductase cytochrome c552 subunit|uniref:ammonia-forming cytochrome c nitrite reductase subunit c552 n=1 Tax=Candidatus Hecatella orcuttiae TaxID=1935119 RepID=UPI002868172A|nr:ammonia-forming cytochrome c nitrite reductase subunit c552 [Candidatus Hecatella orcuttiae]
MAITITILAFGSIAGALTIQANIQASQETYAAEIPSYVGPETCKICHPAQYEEWKDTGHANMILTAQQAQEEGFPLPEGISWDDVAYTLGGIWKIRYINTSGYFITWHYENGVKTPGKNQYNIATGEWVDYHAGEVKKYTCGNCHTTGYDVEAASPEGMPGIVGNWQFLGITCESCHGPGGDHITGPTQNKMVIDVSAEVCGQCHVRGKDITYQLGDPESFSYTHGEKPHKHHQQYHDWIQSEHSESLEHLVALPYAQDYCLSCMSADKILNTDLITLFKAPEVTVENAVNPVTCVNCHNPHSSDLRITRPAVKGYPAVGEVGSTADKLTVCTQCHTGGATVEEKDKERWHHTTGEIFTAIGSVHYASGVTCVDCHMALDTKTAIAYDLRNHTMTVQSYGTYDYTCGQAIGCHKEQGAEWAEQRILDAQTLFSESLEKAEAAISSAETTIITANETAGIDMATLKEAEELLLKAKSRFAYAEADGSEGFHNPTYTQMLLAAALDYAAKAELTASKAIADATIATLAPAEQVETLRAEVSRLQDEISDLQKQNNALKSQNEDLRKLNSDLENQVSSLQAQVSSLQDRVAELEAAAPPRVGMLYVYLAIGVVVGIIIGAAVIFAVKRGK